MKLFKGYFLALLSSATFGLLPLFTLPILQSGDLSESSILFYRFFFGAIAMAILCIILKKDLRIKLKDIATLMALGALYSLTAMGLIFSYRFMDSGVCTTIHFLYPVVVCLLMVSFFKERSSIQLYIAIALSFLGVALLSWNGGSTISWIGVGCVTVTVLTYSTYIVSLNKLKLNHIHPFPLTFYVLLSGSLMFLLYAQFTSGGIEAINQSSTLWNLAGVVLLATIVSNICLVVAVQTVGSTITSILGSMEPTVALIVGALYFHEILTVWTFIGFVLIIVSVVLVVWKNKRKEEKL
ncbi:MAG: EamA family transporter [Bacteroidales bacterium]